MLSPGTGPVSLQISKESKTLPRRQLPPPTSTDDASGPGPKGSKATKLLQSSKQEHTATWEDVILTKPG
uniref:Uncharacterized protein n=1 Tax=Mustela putorius furo TaxID=9669 RepID=M3YHT6_MUSPF